MTTESSNNLQSIRAELSAICGLMDELGVAMSLPMHSFNRETCRYNELPNTDDIDDDVFEIMTDDIMQRLMKLDKRVCEIEQHMGLTPEPISFELHVDDDL